MAHRKARRAGIDGGAVIKLMEEKGMKIPEGTEVAAKYPQPAKNRRPDKKFWNRLLDSTALRPVAPVVKKSRSKGKAK